jgi:hypothetical protein
VLEGMSCFFGNGLFFDNKAGVKIAYVGIFGETARLNLYCMSSHGSALGGALGVGFIPGSLGCFDRRYLTNSWGDGLQTTLQY